MNTEKTIGVLNTLIEINNDRIEGYETAIKETTETDLKILFSQFQQTSLRCNSELIQEVHKLSGTPAEGTTTTGKIHRIWMDFKALMTGKDRVAILNSCAYGDEMAVDTYKEALEYNMEYLNPEQETLVYAQHALLKSNYEEVKILQDLLVEVR